MKELTLRLVDDIADFIAKEAIEIGITSEELIRFMVGVHVQSEKQDIKRKTPQAVVGIDINKLLNELKGGFLKFSKEHLKDRARAGELSCKNCTMKLTEQDIDNGECGSCNAPLKDALNAGDI